MFPISPCVYSIILVPFWIKSFLCQWGDNSFVNKVDNSSPPHPQKFLLGSCLWPKFYVFFWIYFAYCGPPGFSGELGVWGGSQVWFVTSTTTQKNTLALVALPLNYRFYDDVKIHKFIYYDSNYTIIIVRIYFEIYFLKKTIYW